jgi:hypothetical protein
VGQEVIRETEMELKDPSHLGFTTERPAEYHSDRIAVRQAVYDEHVWAALIVNADATLLVRPDGVPLNLFTARRDETTCGNYIIPITAHFET